MSLSQVRDLGLALSQARAQVEQYRQHQAAKQRPAQELIEDLQHFKVCVFGGSGS